MLHCTQAASGSIKRAMSTTAFYQGTHQGWGLCHSLAQLSANKEAYSLKKEERKGGEKHTWG